MPNTIWSVSLWESIHGRKDHAFARSQLRPCCEDLRQILPAHDVLSADRTKHLQEYHTRAFLPSTSLPRIAVNDQHQSFWICRVCIQSDRYVLNLSDSDLAPSSERSSDCTKTDSPASCRRLRIFLFKATSETSPSPSDVVLGRLPFNGSPLGFALFTSKAIAKSILFSKAAIITYSLLIGDESTLIITKVSCCYYSFEKSLALYA